MGEAPRSNNYYKSFKSFSANGCLISFKSIWDNGLSFCSSGQTPFLHTDEERRGHSFFEKSKFPAPNYVPLASRYLPNGIT